jgi:L-ascorbate metabolism protein UlaG (beta-lactamase superfamily)
MHMKTILIIFGVLVLAGVGYLLFTMFIQKDTEPLSENEAGELSPEELEAGRVYIMPITHASFVLDWQEVTIYVDPVGEVASFAQAKKPGLILLTDIHGDHLSTTTIAALMTEETQVVAPQAVADLLPASILEKTTVIANGEKTTQKDFVIEAVPMYNLPETEDSRHPKGRGNGYVVEKEGIRAYIAGDTAGTPEMRALKNINMAFIPMNPPYTMSVEDAAEAVLAFAPSSVYPYHYRGEDGLGDVKKFEELVTAGNSAIDVVLLKWYPEEFTQEAPSL